MGQGMTLSGARLQQIACDTAALLEYVSHGRPFTPHLDVWKVRGKVFLIITDDDPDLQIITATIAPGHYLDKRHWISNGPGTGITTELIEDLVYTPYDLAGVHNPEHS